MTHVTVNVCMNAELKKEFEEFCKELGLSMSAAICLLARAAVRQKRIPFEPTVEKDPYFTPEMIVRIDRAIAQLDAGEGKYHELIEVEDDTEENETEE